MLGMRPQTLLPELRASHKGWAEGQPAAACHAALCAMIMLLPGQYSNPVTGIWASARHCSCQGSPLGILAGADLDKLGFSVLQRQDAQVPVHHLQADSSSV